MILSKTTFWKPDQLPRLIYLEKVFPNQYREIFIYFRKVGAIPQTKGGWCNLGPWIKNKFQDRVVTLFTKGTNNQSMQNNNMIIRMSSELIVDEHSKVGKLKQNLKLSGNQDFFLLKIQKVVFMFWVGGRACEAGCENLICIWKDKPANRNSFPCLATKQSPDEMIRARHRSATLLAHCMGLRNYPSSESQIPPQMGRTHFPLFSEWKTESAWPGPRSDLNPRPRKALSENLPLDQDAWWASRR